MAERKNIYSRDYTEQTTYPKKDYWFYSEIEVGREPIYTTEIIIPVKGKVRTVRAILRSREDTPGVATITIPLTSRVLVTERDAEMVYVFNKFCKYNQRSLGLSETPDIERKAMEALGINYENTKTLKLGTSRGRHPDGHEINSVGFTSSIYVAGSALTCGELFNFTPIVYTPRERCKMFAKILEERLNWNVNPISTNKAKGFIKEGPSSN